MVRVWLSAILPNTSWSNYGRIGARCGICKKLDERASEQALRNFIGGFGFNGDRALEPVAPFSGGEKARLALALLIWQRPNLLLLDEPTNHLDLDMRHALTLALQDYQGALIVVSHDRHLLRTVTDEFLLVAEGRAQPSTAIWTIIATG